MAYRKIALVALMMMSAGTAHAQMGGGGGGPDLSYLDTITDETLAYQFPDKWLPYSSATDAKTVTVLFPTGQTPKKWKQSLKITEFSSTAGVTSANQVKDLLVKANVAKCLSLIHISEPTRPY